MARCKWCGMESSDEYVCEWCKKEIKPRPPDLRDPFLRAPGQTSGPADLFKPEGAAPAPPPAEGGEDIFKPGDAPYPAAPQPKPAPPAPQPVQPAPPQPTQRPAQPAPQPAPQPPVGAPLSPQVAATYRGNAIAVEPWGVRLERFLAIGMPLLLVGAVVVSLTRDQFGPGFAAQAIIAFISGMAMPATGVIGYFDDEYRDVVFALLVTLCLGPVLGAVAYLLIFGGMSRLLDIDFSSSVLGLMGWLVVMSTVLLVATIGVNQFRDPAVIGGLAGISLCGLTVNPFAYLSIWVGWFFGGFFRPLNR